MRERSSILRTHILYTGRKGREIKEEKKLVTLVKLV